MALVHQANATSAAVDRICTVYRYQPDPDINHSVLSTHVPSPSRLVRSTNTIICVINYRLGALGFLYLGPGTTVGGNYGLMVGTPTAAIAAVARTGMCMR